MAVLSIFRGLIYAALAFLVVGLIAMAVSPELPAEVEAFLASENAGSLGTILDGGSRGSQLAVVVLLGAFLLGYIAALLGMLGFRGWARWLFIVLIPVSLVLEGAFGTSISGAVESVMTTLTSMIDGALLTLLFVEPVRARFRAGPAQPPPPTPSPYGQSS